MTTPFGEANAAVLPPKTASAAKLSASKRDRKMSPLPFIDPSGLSSGRDRGHRNPTTWTSPNGLTQLLRLGLVPVVTNAEIDRERRIEGVCGAHFPADKLFHGADL